MKILHILIIGITLFTSVQEIYAMELDVVEQDKPSIPGLCQDVVTNVVFTFLDNHELTNIVGTNKELHNLVEKYRREGLIKTTLKLSLIKDMSRIPQEYTNIKELTLHFSNNIKPYATRIDNACTNACNASKITESLLMFLAPLTASATLTLTLSTYVSDGMAMFISPCFLLAISKLFFSHEATATHNYKQTIMNELQNLCHQMPHLQSLTIKIQSARPSSLFPPSPFPPSLAQMLATTPFTNMNGINVTFTQI